MSELPAVSEEEFRKVCDFLYRRTGMLFTEAKRYYVAAAHRRAHGVRSSISSFTTYFAYLRSDADGEIEKFINAFTVNETYFYREEHQLRCLSSDLLTERVRAKRPGEALRIWSVPCSTGEEPYSIAIWLLENWPEVDVQDIEIVGSDIDTECVTRPRARRIRQARADAAVAGSSSRNTSSPAARTAGRSSTTCANPCSSPRSTSSIRPRPAGTAASMSSSAATC